MGAERRKSAVGGGGMNKNVGEGFPKGVIPELRLKWRAVVIQLDNSGKAYPGDGLFEESKTP